MDMEREGRDSVEMGSTLDGVAGKTTKKISFMLHNIGRMGRTAVVELEIMHVFGKYYTILATGAQGCA